MRKMDYRAIVPERLVKDTYGTLRADAANQGHVLPGINGRSHRTNQGYVGEEKSPMKHWIPLAAMA